MTKTHPTIGHPRSRMAHAEMKCLSKAPKSKISGGILHIYRLDKDDNIKIAKPCSHCMNEIKKTKIKRIIYSTEMGAVSVKV